MGKGSSDTTQTVKQDIPQWLSDASQNIYQQGQNVANLPYTPYTGEGVAPLNPTQNLGIGTITNAINSGVGGSAIQSGIQGATAGMNYTPQTVTAQSQTPGAIASYMNPYTQDVTNAALGEINHQTGIQQATNAGAATQAGAFGGSRQGVVEGETNKNADIEANNTIANLNNTGYTNAQTQFDADANRNLTAQQSNQAAGLQGASLNTQASGLLGTLGAGYDADQTSLGNAAINAGGVAQATQQNADTFDYNQFLRQIGYPAQQLGTLEGSIGSLPGQGGSTSQPVSSNPWATGLGVATGAAGLANSTGLSGYLGGLLGGGSTLASGATVGGAALGGSVLGGGASLGGSLGTFLAAA